MNYTASSLNDKTLPRENDIKNEALAAYDAGLCVLPPKEDGSKAPILPWSEFQHERPSHKQVTAWYGYDRTGLGVLCGVVSGNLECLEAEDLVTYQLWRDTADAAGIGALIGRIEAGYLDKAPRGGRHLLYRCETIGGNTRLASRPTEPGERRHDKDLRRALMETRGEGGYIVCSPSHGNVHPTGRAYERISGGFDTITEITPDEREQLHRLARSLDRMPPAEPLPSIGSTRTADGGDRPGDLYNAQVTWDDILVPHGWTHMFTRGGTSYWRRPGKTEGISATTNVHGSDLLWMFTSSTAFEPDRSYTKFGAYTVLEHNGDFAAAGRELFRLGYKTNKTDDASFTMNGKVPHESQDEGGRRQQEDEPVWPERQPLPPPPSAPPLPEDMIPASLRPWIVDVAARTRMPIEMVAAPAIVGLGAIIGRSIGIRPWRHDTFVTVPNLWGTVAARPGSMKSSAIDEALAPVRRLAAQARDDYTEKKEAAAVELVVLNAQLKAIESRISEAAKQNGDLDALKEKLKEKRDQIKEATPVERRYITHDATVEKIGELLKNNPRGMMVVRDEIYGLLKSFDKSGRENDRQFYLEAWSGTGSFTSDRIERGTVYIPALALSVIGGIQPGRLRPIVNGSTDEGSDDDGLIQRFQIFVWPDKLGPWSRPDRPLNSAVRDQAFAVFNGLDALTWHTAGARKDHDGDIPYLTFTVAAQAKADAWRDALEHRLRSDELEAFPSFAAHLSKYRSLMPALAEIFHLVAFVQNEPGVTNGKVDEAATNLAIRWCGEFLEAHARKLYDAELGPGRAAARALATKIMAGAVHDGMTVREIYKLRWSGLTTDEAVIAGTTVLSDLGWARIETRSTGGRPSQVIRLHPELCQIGTGG